MKELAKLVIVPTIICLMAGLLLAWVSDLTSEPIRLAQMKQRAEAMKKVLPPCDDPSTNHVINVDEFGSDWSFQLAFSNDTFAGVAFETKSSEGYGFFGRRIESTRIKPPRSVNSTLALSLISCAIWCFVREHGNPRCARSTLRVGFKFALHNPIIPAWESTDDIHVVHFAPDAVRRRAEGLPVRCRERRRPLDLIVQAGSRVPSDVDSRESDLE